MIGETQMGPRAWPNQTRAIDNAFSSVFLMGSWRTDFGDILAGRVEHFSLEDRTDQQSFTEENGWSVTTSWRRPISKTIEVGLEALYIEHDREINRAAGDQQSGVQAQWMLRAKF